MPVSRTVQSVLEKRDVDSMPEEVLVREVHSLRSYLSPLWFHMSPSAVETTPGQLTSHEEVVLAYANRSFINTRNT